ncbi:AMP-dependent synthetase/ligase [Blastococcus brunescens]|uniref:AMP-binding protein n=1 Tax=Blastococcus brunescens TaxID=1564165 RepID=A0ABZ1B5B0_9ACTN|nr:AMP-binding protein [Blastococcus sp. BMG 8361]WRL66000.1 AMP-binding protein [Blastococcus sp. BMG 8361]
MREFSVPATSEVGPDEALTDMLATNVAEHGAEVGLRARRNGQWQDVTWKEFGAQVDGVAKGLIAAGVAAGDRVALQAKTRYEWTVFDFAIWTAGAAVVPIYETSSPDQVAWILSDSGATAIVVEKDEHASAVESVRDQAPDLRSVHVIDDGAVDQLIQAGKDVPDSELAARRATLTADSLATLIYTSGTTGRPKGCELTHGNFLFEINNGMSLLGRFMNVQGSLLLFIPWHTCSPASCRSAPSRPARSSGTPPTSRTWWRTSASSGRPSSSPSRGCSRRSSTAPRPRPRATARARSSTRPPRWPSTGPAPRTPAAPVSASRPSTRCSTSSSTANSGPPSVAGASAPSPAALPGRATGPLLPRHRRHGLRGLRPHRDHRRGVGQPRRRPAHRHRGPPLPGVEFRIADDGEVLIRGGIVMRGYWRNEDATKEAIDAEGFFHTGDLGELDGDGFLKITGRKKEILVTAGGKNVAPRCWRTGCARTVWSASASSSATSARSSAR